MSCGVHPDSTLLSSFWARCDRGVFRYLWCWSNYILNVDLTAENFRISFGTVIPGDDVLPSSVSISGLCVVFDEMKCVSINQGEAQLEVDESVLDWMIPAIVGIHKDSFTTCSAVKVHSVCNRQLVNSVVRPLNALSWNFGNFNGDFDLAMGTDGSIGS